jgi:hypothetical protein
VNYINGLPSRRGPIRWGAPKNEIKIFFNIKNN